MYKRLEGLHRESFPPAQCPVAAASTSVDEEAIQKRHRTESLRGISVLARKRRRQAVNESHVSAAAEIAQEVARIKMEQEAAQRSLDELWRRLNANEAAVVMTALSAAFEDNDAAAAPLDVEGSEASIVVIVPTASAMPTKKPALTPTGRPTLKAMPKKEAADWHKTAVCGCVIVTVKEAFAVAPGLNSVRIVAVALPGLDSYGNQTPEVLLAARFERQRLEGVRWSAVDAVRVINDTSSELQLRQVGVTKALMPIELTSEPQLKSLLQGFDYGELAEA